MASVHDTAAGMSSDMSDSFSVKLRLDPLAACAQLYANPSNWQYVAF